MASTLLDVDTPAGPGSVQLERPPRARGLVLLTHGAGGGAQTIDLLAIRAALVADGIAVGLVTQPYRVAGRRAPPQPAAQDAAWLAVVAGVRAGRALRGMPLIVGGRSNGARVACRTALAVTAVGVAALAFPLHPPGRPDKSRLDELDASGVPTLVVQGDRDPFGLPPPGSGREVVMIPGADHSLKRDPGAVAVAVHAFVTGTIERAKVLT